MKAIKGTIHTITNGVIEDGIVLIDGGKITAVGKAADIVIPDQCVEIEAGEVMPGLIDCHTHICVFGEPRTMPGLQPDGNEMTSPVTANVSVLDAINPQDKSIDAVRNAGFTSVCILPGSANLIGGVGVTVKLRGNTAEEMMIPGTEQMKMALGENPKRVYGANKQAPGTRMGSAAIVRETFNKAKEYGAKKQAAIDNDTPDKAPAYDAKMEALLPVLAGTMKVRIHCHQANDIMTAVRLAKEFNLQFAIEHATEGHIIAEALAENNVTCTVGPFLMGLSKQEVWNQTLETCGILERAGVDVCATMDDGINTRYLPTVMGLLMKSGFSEQGALESLTIRPARNLGIDHLVGSIEVGKDADIACFDGHPFHNMTNCTMVMIDGVVYPQ